MAQGVQRNHPRSPLRILIADPDADTRSIYRETLRLVGWDVVEANDGRDALTQALVRPPSLILTEAVLPVIDGFALCEILRRDSTTRGVPLVVVTADARPAHHERLKHVGVDAVLVKPIILDALVTEIRRLTSKSEGGRTVAGARHATAVADARHPDRRTRKPLAKAHLHGATTTPSNPATALRCPYCEKPLQYQARHMGGMTARRRDHWDDYICSTCGAFQYQQHTRKMRRVK
jgi:CheY-like chemotaxis protein